MLHSLGRSGRVSVKTTISPLSTAVQNKDYRVSEVTLTFQTGEYEKFLTLTIFGDDIPELDERIIIKLVDPTGGAAIEQGTGNNVTVVILANDVVAGYVGFSEISRAVVVKEGEIVNLGVVRTFSTAGSVSVDWLIRGKNVSRDFNITSGTVIFHEVSHMLVPN